MEPAEQSFSLGVSGDPEIHPNRGPNQQVEIPNVMPASEYRRILHDDHEAEDHIPIIWIKDVEENNEHDPLRHTCNSIRVTNKSDPETEIIDTTLANGNSNVQQETNIGVHEKNRGIGYCAVPETPSATWNELEKDTFTLGLYIFGKKFAHVKTFVGTKNMNDIQSFYYGMFYKSEAYRRWHECVKMKGGKCINYGQKIFTGERQEEFLSRLLQNKSDKCLNKLHKVSQKFVEEEMNLPQYVFALKDLVGLKDLVEAIAIGKGVRDLTGFNVNSNKSKAPPGTPIGKDCSMLTPAGIISIIRGNFRFSKTRSNNLFWDAVWPRLLAKGWHSEQPNDDKHGASSSSSKPPLFFLVPGVTKFSRKLVKGAQYFDSISDVLTKVGADPGLIEPDTVANNDCTSKEINGVANETNSDREISPDQQHHCFLKPRTPNGSIDVKKFTIVDTSLGGGKMRELRSLPDEVVEPCAVEYGNDVEDASEEQTNEADIVGNISTDRGKIDSTNASKSIKAKGILYEMIGTENNSSKQVVSTRSIGSTNPFAATNIGKQADDPVVETISEHVDHSENQHDIKSRRKSRRRQQPIIKPLEALANGYLDINERRKRKLRLQDNLMPVPRTSWSTRSKVVGETSHNGVPMLPDFINKERANVGCNGSGHGNGEASVICAGLKSGEGYRWPCFRVPGKLGTK